MKNYIFSPNEIEKKNAGIFLHINNIKIKALVYVNQANLSKITISTMQKVSILEKIIQSTPEKPCKFNKFEFELLDSLKWFPRIKDSIIQYRLQVVT